MSTGYLSKRIAISTDHQLISLLSLGYTDYKLTRLLQADHIPYSLLKSRGHQWAEPKRDGLIMGGGGSKKENGVQNAQQRTDAQQSVTGNTHSI